MSQEWVGRMETCVTEGAFHRMEHIPAKRLSDNALVHIFPTRNDPAEQIPSQRADGIETIIWHEDKYEVFSIDLEYPAQPAEGFTEALIDYCQDYYKHYDGYPVEFEYKDKVYPYEYYIDYLPEDESGHFTEKYPREQGRD